MELERLIMDNVHGLDANQMRMLIRKISCFVDAHASDEDKYNLLKSVYGVISDGHYDKEFAVKDISNMHYDDANGIRHNAPFFTESEVQEMFSRHMDELSDYTIHDFAVTLNMVWSDNNRTLCKYAKEGCERREMAESMAVEYLCDQDAPHPRNKIWMYING